MRPHNFYNGDFSYKNLEGNILDINGVKKIIFDEGKGPVCELHSRVTCKISKKKKKKFDLPKIVHMVGYLESSKEIFVNSWSENKAHSVSVGKGLNEIKIGEILKNSRKITSRFGFRNFYHEARRIFSNFYSLPMWIWGNGNSNAKNSRKRKSNYRC
jgi:hypothetical protein